MIEVKGAFTKAKIFTENPVVKAIEQIEDTADVIKVVKPVYNFKAAEELQFWQKKRKSKTSNIE